MDHCIQNPTALFSVRISRVLQTSSYCLLWIFGGCVCFSGSILCSLSLPLVACGIPWSKKSFISAVQSTQNLKERRKVEQAASARRFSWCSAIHGSLKSSSDWLALLAWLQCGALLCSNYLNCFTEPFLELCRHFYSVYEVSWWGRGRLLLFVGCTPDSSWHGLTDRNECLETEMRM